MANNQHFSFVVLGLAVASLSAGCSSSDEGSEVTDRNLELYSWWTNPGETDALAALLDEYRALHPETTVINATVDDVNNAQQQLQTRMSEGAPPDTFQAMGGGDLLRWVVPDGSQTIRMEAVDEVADSLNLRGVVPETVVDAVSHDGRMYAIPIGVHRFNLLFYNKQLFEKHSVEVPESLSDFYEVAEVFKAEGVVPLALGSKEGWPLSILALDGMFIATAGVNFRDSYLRGRESADDPRVGMAISEVAKVLEYTNEDRDAQNWDEAAQMVVEGKAAMTIMGDWAKGFFVSQGLRAGVELGQAPIPGTNGVFVYLVDSFTLPKGAQNRAAAVDFLNLVGSERMQSIFNPIKGSTPPRTDVDLELYDSLARNNIAEFKSNTLAPGSSVLISNPDFIFEFDAAMKQFGIDGDQDAVKNMLKNWYDLLE
jgi:glucose/mannose transport system substrate-binding protein